MEEWKRDLKGVPPETEKKKKKKHESEVNLKWATPKTLCTQGPKIEYSQKKIVFSTMGISGPFFAGFGVCSDDWKKGKKKTKMKKHEKKKKRENEETSKMIKYQKKRKINEHDGT